MLSALEIMQRLRRECGEEGNKEGRAIMDAAVCHYIGYRATSVDRAKYDAEYVEYTEAS